MTPTLPMEGSEELSRFSRYLEIRQLKQTSQRSTILTEFLQQRQHVSAEELYIGLHQKHPEIGQATVFRTLRLIAEAGLAAEVSIDSRTTRYEQAGLGHHDHLQCLRCGQVIEFQDERVETLQLEIAARYGVQLVRHRLELFGICSQCQQEEQHVQAT